MNRVLKNTLEAFVWIFSTVLVICGCVASWLIYPGSPGSAQHLAFQGYIVLPKTGTLSILDYLTISDHRLFVTEESSGNVYKIALRADMLPGESDISTFALEPAAHGVAIDPFGQMAYVTRSEANTVDVFDPVHMKLSKRISVADDPDGIFYEPLHKVLYVASGDAHVATVIDPTAGAMVATIPLDGKPEFAAYDPQSHIMYQNLRDTNSVVAVDLDSKTVANRWALQGCEGPSGMTLDDANRRLFIVCSGNAALVVFDLIQKTVIATVKIGGGPDSVAYDVALHRLYTTGKSGVLVVIQQETPDAYHVIDTVHLHYGAHTLAVDPDTHRLYVGYAGLIVPPRVAVFMSRS
jgi:DNA-binding beta-propeller fold protein YncE